MAAADARQTSLDVPAPPAVDVVHLRLMLGYWGVYPKSARTLARKVDEGRWEFEVASGGPPSHVNPPPLRAAGRTREECLRAAAEAAREALLTHLADIDRVVARLTEKRADIAALLGAHAAVPPAAPASAPTTTATATSEAA